MMDDFAKNMEALGGSVLTPGRKKRKAKAKNPIVDDQVRRRPRFRKEEVSKHIQLDDEPRKRKERPRNLSPSPQLKTSGLLSLVEAWKLTWKLKKSNQFRLSLWYVLESHSMASLLRS